MVKGLHAKDNNNDINMPLWDEEYKCLQLSRVPV